MNVYLDVDGVMLDKHLHLSRGAVEVLRYMTTNHQVFWLSTRCRTDPTARNLRRDLGRLLGDEDRQLLDHISVAKWGMLKTDGINFNAEFLWLDDQLTPGEEVVLRKHNALNYHVHINTHKKRNDLIDWFSKFKQKKN